MIRPPRSSNTAGRGWRSRRRSSAFRSHWSTPRARRWLLGVGDGRHEKPFVGLGDVRNRPSAEHVVKSRHREVRRHIPEHGPWVVRDEHRAPVAGGHDKRGRDLGDDLWGAVAAQRAPFRAQPAQPGERAVHRDAVQPRPRGLHHGHPGPLLVGAHERVLGQLLSHRRSADQQRERGHQTGELASGEGLELRIVCHARNLRSRAATLLASCQLLSIKRTNATEGQLRNSADSYAGADELREESSQQHVGKPLGCHTRSVHLFA